MNIYKAGNGPSLYTKGDKKGTLDEASAEKSELVEGATVSDAVMSADGEYTVSIKDLDLGKDKEGNFYMLDIATNIVKDDVNSAVKAKASSIKVNGKEIATNVDLPAKGDLKKGAYYKFMIANGYAPEDKTSPDPLYQAIKDNAPNTELAAPTGKFDIEVTFKIEGVDWTYVPSAPTATPVPTQAPQVTAPPEVPLSTSFDMVLSANVVEALTPSAGPDIRQDPTDAKKAIQSAVFGSEAMKTKVTAAKSADGKALFDPIQWIISFLITPVLQSPRRVSMHCLLQQEAICRISLRVVRSGSQSSSMEVQALCLRTSTSKQQRSSLVRVLPRRNMLGHHS